MGLACGGTIDVLVEPLVRPEAEAAACGTRDGRGDLRRCRPTRRRPSSGRTSRATVRRRRPLTVHDDGRLDGDAGSAADDGRSVAAAMEALGRGLSRTVAIGGRQFFIEAYPVRPRLVVVGAVAGGAFRWSHIARELGYETVVVDGRAAFATPARFPDVDRLIVGWPDEVAEEIGLGPERRRRGPDPRREVRRAGDRRVAPPGRAVCRRGRIEEDPGGPARRGCSRPA